MDIQQEVFAIKKQLAELILAHLKENKIPATVAQQQAADFLRILPVADHAELLGKLKLLSDIYEESREIYLQELSKTNSEETDTKLNEIRNAIAGGNMNNAIEVAKTMEDNK